MSFIPFCIQVDSPYPIECIIHMNGAPPIPLVLGANNPYQCIPNTGLEELRFSQPMQVKIRYIDNTFESFEVNNNINRNLVFRRNQTRDAVAVYATPILYALGRSYTDRYYDIDGRIKETGIMFVGNQGLPFYAPPYAFSGFPRVQYNCK
jgi:hypothetical protein